MPTNNIITTKLFFTNEGEIKAFLYEQKWREFITPNQPHKKI
jgi:hypothetical protein